MRDNPAPWCGSLSLSLSLLLSLWLSDSFFLFIPLHNHNINLLLSLPSSSIPSSKTTRLQSSSGYTPLSSLLTACLFSFLSLYLLHSIPLRFIQTWDRLSLVFSLFSSLLSLSPIQRHSWLESSLSGILHHGYSRNWCLYTLHSSLCPPLWFLSPRHANTRFFWVWIFFLVSGFSIGLEWLMSVSTVDRSVFGPSGLLGILFISSLVCPPFLSLNTLSFSLLSTCSPSFPWWIAFCHCLSLLLSSPSLLLYSPNTRHSLP